MLSSRVEHAPLFSWDQRLHSRADGCLPSWCRHEPDAEQLSASVDAYQSHPCWWCRCSNRPEVYGCSRGLRPKMKDASHCCVAFDDISPSRPDEGRGVYQTKQTSHVEKDNRNQTTTSSMLPHATPCCNPGQLHNFEGFEDYGLAGSGTMHLPSPLVNPQCVGQSTTTAVKL